MTAQEPTARDATPRATEIVKVFAEVGDFAAMNAAEEWCASQGISVGRSERGKPRGLLYGDFDIAKWHNLRGHEIAALDGLMQGDGRNGPITVQIRSRATKGTTP